MPADRLRTTGRRDDAGFTLIVVVMVSFVIMLVSTVLLNDAVAQSEQANDQRREDQLIAGAESIIDRYASKLTVNPQYYLQRVDESERARTCTQLTHPSLGVEVAAGTDWIDGCAEWDYLSAPAVGDWFSHPLVGTDNEMEGLIEVSPPADGAAIEVRVVARIPGTGQARAISAEIQATSLAEFVRVTERDLRYGSGAALTGKVYSGGNLSFQSGASVSQDVFAEGDLLLDNSQGYVCPTFLDGAEAFDSGSGNCNAGNIRTQFPEALSFSSFWDDLERLREVACGGSGLCFNNGFDAYLIHPHIVGTTPRITVWGSNSTPPAMAGCGSLGSTEGRWWNLVHDPSVAWTPLGTFDYPGNGVLWVDGDAILGNRGPNPAAPAAFESRVSGGLTIVAGSAGDIENFIYNAEVVYDDPNSFDIIGMIASDEFIINPWSVGADHWLELRGAVLSQEDRWRIAQYCGDVANYVRWDAAGNVTFSTSDDMATLNVTGSIASPSTGNPSGSFDDRFYGFDPRFEFLRPPFYPLLGDDWSYENWSEDSLPDWAQNAPTS